MLYLQSGAYNRLDCNDADVILAIVTTMVDSIVMSLTWL